MTKRPIVPVAEITPSCPKTNFSNWRIYAAAAGASLAMSSDANAAIIHTTLDQTLSITASNTTTGKSARFQLAGLTETMQLRKSADYGVARINGGIEFATTGARPAGSGFEAAKNFALGSIIGPLVPVTDGGATFLAKHSGSGADFGAFRDPNGTGFLGFNTGRGDYGWLRVMVSDAGSPNYPNELEVLDYAYDTTGNPIPAGFTGAPEPGTSALAVLALGAAGITAWRRRRNEAA
jgi:MYXO-CTERM domain-containing protein